MAVFHTPPHNAQSPVNLASVDFCASHGAAIDPITQTGFVVFSEDHKTNYQIVLRQPNPSFPLDLRLSDRLRGLFEEHQQGRLHSSVDCSELSEVLALELQSNERSIMLISATNKGESILVPEWRSDLNALALARYCYHSVLKVKGYILDPRLAGTPIPKGDYFQLVKGVNPKGVIRHQTLSPDSQSKEILSIIAASHLKSTNT